MLESTGVVLLTVLQNFLVCYVNYRRHLALAACLRQKANRINIGSQSHWQDVKQILTRRWGSW